MKWNLYPVGDLPRFAREWDALNEAHARSPLLTYRFVAALVTHFGNPSVRLAQACDDAGATRALVLIEDDGPFKMRTFQPSQAPVSPLVMAPDMLLDEFGRSLSRSLGYGTQVFGITQVDPEIYPRPQASGPFSTLDYIETARITVTGTFDDFWAGRGKNLRQNTNKTRNRLDKAGVRTTLEVLGDPGDARAGVADYGTIEAASWKAESGTAISPDNAQGRFYADLLEAFMATGDGAIVRYLFDDHVVATDLCISGFGVFVILKTTYDDAYSKHSPAMLMRHHLFPRFFEEGTVERIEFYGKVMDWHRRWTDEIRVLYHANVHRLPMLRRMRAMLGSGAHG